MESLSQPEIISEPILALSSEHPFALGTRVRHDGRQWSQEPFATVTDVRSYPDGSYEYSVDVDGDANFGPSGPRSSQWSSHRTLGIEIDQ